MKNPKPLFAAALIALIFLSSCSQQLYSYRQKVPAQKAIAKADPAMPPAQISNKPATSSDNSLANTPLPAPSATNPLAVAPATQSTKEKNKEAAVIADIKKMEPATGGKASGIRAALSFNPVQKQLKAIKKDLKSAPASDIDARRWMILGIILMLIGLVIEIITFGILGHLISSVGFIIFIIGLIFFLLDRL